MAEDNPTFRTDKKTDDAHAPAQQGEAQAEQQPKEKTETPAERERRLTRRKRLLLLLAVVVGVVGLAVLTYHFLVGVNHVSTDNAYVGADTAQITPLVNGPVAEVRVENTQYVSRGTILVVIDPADARLALERAAADLAQARRQLQETRSTGGALGAQIAARESDVARAKAEQIQAASDLEKARTDLARRERLIGAGAVSGEELTTARNAFQSARARVAVAAAALAQAQANRTAARQQLAANQALTQGSTEDNPDVAAARARYDAAKLDLERTIVRAPIGGIVAQRNVQVGQRVMAGSPIMTVVPANRMYVDANFKENQLRKVRVGQPAIVTSDLYGGGVVYHGRVVGMAGGTGSAFALIPAQNATGNWIKVVQRLPVRVLLDAKELDDHPLRVGLSMDVDVDVSNR